MIEIKNAVEFNEKLKAFRSSHKKVLTNCFMMPDEIGKLAASGSIFISEYPDWLFVICDRKGYKNLYYYATEEADPIFAGKLVADNGYNDLYIDIVTRSGRGDTHTPARLIECGLAENYKSYQRMQIPTKDIDLEKLSVSLHDGYRVSTDYCNTEELHSLWKCNLDEKSTPLPGKDELEAFCRDGNLITVLDNNNELCAVVVLDVGAKNVLVQHLAVSPLHRRKGLANYIMSKALIIACEKELKTATLWVDRKNSSAIALYDRLGYTVDGMICDQLYMKGN